MIGKNEDTSFSSLSLSLSLPLSLPCILHPLLQSLNRGHVFLAPSKTRPNKFNWTGAELS